MDIVSRLKRYMEYLQIRSSEFADTTGIPRPTLSQLLNGRNKKISNDIISKIHDAFPNLNVMWLMFGDGEMETNSNFKISEAEIDRKHENSQDQIDDNELFSNLNLFTEEFRDLQSEKINQQKDMPERSFEAPKSINPAPTPSQPSFFSAAQSVALQPDKTKRVQSIMVFYSDNSFEIFKPAE